MTTAPPTCLTKAAGQRLLLMMGFDFGTAFSKVVVRPPDWPSAGAFAVDFGGLANKESPYLLPTALYVGRDGAFSLDQKDGAPLPHDIKYGLMKGNVRTMQACGYEVPYVNACAAYLALAFRLARKQFMRQHGQMFEGLSPEWEFINVGIPAATKSDNQHKLDFQRAVNAAGALANSGKVITTDLVAGEIGRANCAEKLCELVPEIVAQIQGYKRSDVRRKGWHIMADAGASTLDICVFNLLTDFLKGVDILTPIRNIKGGDINVCHAAVPELGAKILQREIKGWSATHDAEAIEAAFWKKCESAVREAVFTTRKYRFIPDILPFLMCGGASVIPGYKALPDNAKRGLLTGGRDFDVCPMPVPGDMNPRGLPENIYHRLSVAYGLSVRFFDDVMLPPEMPPDESGGYSAPTYNWRDNYTSKDMM